MKELSVGALVVIKDEELEDEEEDGDVASRPVLRPPEQLDDLRRRGREVRRRRSMPRRAGCSPPSRPATSSYGVTNEQLAAGTRTGDGGVDKGLGIRAQGADHARTHANQHRRRQNRQRESPISGRRRGRRRGSKGSMITCTQSGGLRRTKRFKRPR